MINTVLTKDERNKLSPDKVVEHLKEGNQRFRDNELIKRDAKAMVKDSNSGQAPKAVILSCIDSRVPVEEVFDQGIGDIFVARVAGNIVNGDVLGSMEYACAVAGSRLIVVMGHEHCGAVDSAIKDVKVGNVTGLLAKIRESIPLVSKNDFEESERNAQNKDFVNAVIKSNVLNTIETLKKNSQMLNDMASDSTPEEDRIKIVGAVYRMQDGKVEFFN